MEQRLNITPVLEGPTLSPEGTPDNILIPLNPGAPYISHFSSWGGILSQETVVNGYAAGYHQVSVEDARKLSFLSGPGSLSLYYMLSGRLAIQLPEGEVTLGRGEHCLIYFPPHTVVRASVHAGGQTFLLVHLEPSLFVKLSHDTPAAGLLRDPAELRGAFASQPIQSGSLVSPLTARLISGLRHPDRNYYPLNSLCLSLAARFISAYNATAYQSRWSGRKRVLLVDLKEFVLAHLSSSDPRALSTAFLARRTGLSADKFYRLFNDIYGCPPGKYVHMERMGEALRLLSSTALPVGEVAVLTGYEEFSSFTRAFKNFYGYPPSSVRR